MSSLIHENYDGLQVERVKEDECLIDIITNPTIERKATLSMLTGFEVMPRELDWSSPDALERSDYQAAFAAGFARERGRATITYQPAVSGGKKGVYDFNTLEAAIQATLDITGNEPVIIEGHSFTSLASLLLLDKEYRAKFTDQEGKILPTITDNCLTGKGGEDPLKGKTILKINASKFVAAVAWLYQKIEEYAPAIVQKIPALPLYPLAAAQLHSGLKVPLKALPKEWGSGKYFHPASAAFVKGLDMDAFIAQIKPDLQGLCIATSGDKLFPHKTQVAQYRQLGRQGVPQEIYHIHCDEIGHRNKTERGKELLLPAFIDHYDHVTKELTKLF